MVSHSASHSTGRSSRSGPTSTNSQPRFRAASMLPRSLCWLTPPPPTMLFFSAMPPKARMMSVCFATCSHETALRVTSSNGPMMCGRMTLEAPAE